jgi:hypothetical protein
MPSAPHPVPAVPGGRRRSGHSHTTRCYWDVQVCGWHCPPPADPVPPAAADALGPAEPVVGAAPV